MRNQLTILYHTDNYIDAQQIIDDLSGYNIDLVPISEKDFKYNILAFCESVESPVLLLLSHNWLTSAECLYNSLPGLKELYENNKLFITTVDGVEEENGVQKRIPTEIEKIRDVIPYMKYWQEAFLEARYNRINAATTENIELEKTTKVISLSLGDLLNFLRPINHPKLSALQRSNYQPVFDQFNFTVEKVEKQDSPTPDLAPKPEPVLEKEPEPTENQEISQTIQEPDSNPIDSIQEESFVRKPTIEQATVATPIIQKVTKVHTTTLEEKTVASAPSETVSQNGSSHPEVATATKETGQEKTKEATQEKIRETTQEKINEHIPEVKEELKEESTPKEQPIESTEEIEIIDLSIDNVLEQAVQYFKEGKDQAGFDLFEAAIRNNYEDNATLRYYYAYYLAQRKSAFDEAIHQLDTILLYDSKNDNAYFLLAELAEIKENYALAKNYYLQTRQLNPDYPHINYRIGVILQDQFQGAEKEAAEYLEAEIRKDPENVDAIYRLGIYYSESKENYELAKDAFLKVLDLDAEHAFANYDLALIYHKQEDAFKAAYYYKKGCINNPELKTEQNDIAFLAPAENKLKETAQPLQEPTFIAQPKVETKTILITGATSGIGLATAEKFANEGGCRLILSGRRRNRLVQIKDAITENFDIDVEILQFDVRDYVAVKEAIGTLKEPFNHVDVLINNAGLALGLSSIASGDLADWETMIDTNIKGLLYTTKEIAPLMIAQNGGHIINIGSIAGKEAYPNGNVYNATKAAVEILTKAMRLDLHKYNIRVGQVAPGHVETEFAINRFHGDEAKASIYEDFTPLAAGDIANIIYFMVNQPEHVNIQDVLVFPTQQASATVINRSGRK